MTTAFLAESTQLLAASAKPELHWLGWIIIGGLAGWIGSKIMGTDAQMGIFANIIVGIIGGFLGGFVLGLFGAEGSNSKIFSFLTCLLGSCILLWIIKLVTGKGRN